MDRTDRPGRPEGLDRLNNWQRAALGAAIVIVIAGMVGGFWSSFNNLYNAAAGHGWDFPALLPLCVDSGILAYVVLDQLAVTIGGRSHWLHYVAWGLAGFTVWANAAVAPAGGIWRVIYAAMPALWVLGVEALRFFWRLLRNGPAEPRDRIPAGRWIAAPFATAAVQRRMWLLNETSWRRMAAIEDARLYARDLVRAAPASAPAMLRGRIRSGRLPAAVLAEIDTSFQLYSSADVDARVQDWVASQIALPDLAAADLQTARRTIALEHAAPPPELTAGLAPETGPEAAPAARPKPPRKAAPDYTRKPSAKAVKGLTPEALAPYVEAWLATPAGAPTIAAVTRAFHVGDVKARDALQIATRAPGELIEMTPR